tara:strand:- start:8696 stop:9112 length:417 start_codon:yes stop_codon:yes gene_type:complete
VVVVVGATVVVVVVVGATVVVVVVVGATVVVVVVVGATVVVVVVGATVVVVVVGATVVVLVVVGQLVGKSIQFSHVPVEQTRIMVAPIGSVTVYPATKSAAETCVSNGDANPSAFENKSNGPAAPPGGMVKVICINMS